MGKRLYLQSYVWVTDDLLKNELIVSPTYLLRQNKFPVDPQM